MFGIMEIDTRGANLPRFTFSTFAEAIEFAKSKFSITVFEIDEDEENAADFITEAGTVYAIQHTTKEAIG